jgi:uncharacterized protein
VKNGADVLVSARPSDAVALALRIGAPILVRDELMDAEGKVLDLDDNDDIEVLDEQDEAELVAELREFLDSVRPEDFDQ